MPNLPVLEVAIALVFVYVVFSGFVSAIHEWLARFLELRSKTLKTSIGELLQDAGPTGSPIGTLSNAFHEHPLINGLSLDRKTYASYIPSKTFAAALRDLAVVVQPTTGGTVVAAARDTLPDGTSIDPRSKRLLNALIAGTYHDIEAVEARLAKWFDDSMERVSGVYKRHAQLYLVVIAALFTLAFNIDTVVIGRHLWNDSRLRDAFVSHATALVKSPKGAGSDTGLVVDSVSAAINRKERDYLLGALPIGWGSADFNQPSCDAWWCIPLTVLIRACGLALTVLALSLGAPFWFDLLGKLVNLRQTGVPPDEIAAKAKG